MINNDRIVPITAIDLISMYGVICNTAEDYNAVSLEPTTTDGAFEITKDVTIGILSEPMRTCNLGASVAFARIWFVPAYDYSGFTINGVAVTTKGDTVIPDGRTLYEAGFQDGGLRIAKLGF